MQSFDICIPTWDSLDYLKIAIKSIQDNSALKHRIIVHDNGSSDATWRWLKRNNIDHTHIRDNEGFCGVNHALKRVESDHVMVFNTDMYALPQWDLEIVKQINEFKRYNIKEYTISSCLIEPTGNNPEYGIADFGQDYQTFDEPGLLKHFRSFKCRYLIRKDTVQYSHPILFPTQMLKRIGYFDPDYFPGWACDHDIAARAYNIAGCRHFVMLGKSRVYHFSSKTFKKLPANVQAMHGEDLFFNKWQRTVFSFRQLIGIRHEYNHPKL